VLKYLEREEVNEMRLLRFLLRFLRRVGLVVGLLSAFLTACSFILVEVIAANIERIIRPKPIGAAEVIKGTTRLITYPFKIARVRGLGRFVGRYFPRIYQNSEWFWQERR